MVCHRSTWQMLATTIDRRQLRSSNVAMYEVLRTLKLFEIDDGSVTGAGQGLWNNLLLHLSDSELVLLSFRRGAYTVAFRTPYEYFISSDYHIIPRPPSRLGNSSRPYFKLWNVAAAEGCRTPHSRRTTVAVSATVKRASGLVLIDIARALCRGLASLVVTASAWPAGRPAYHHVVQQFCHAVAATDAFCHRASLLRQLDSSALHHYHLHHSLTPYVTTVTRCAISLIYRIVKSVDFKRYLWLYWIYSRYTNKLIYLTTNFENCFAHAILRSLWYLKLTNVLNRSFCT